ncbi:hypothetical protein FALBO_10736, partial [Fusarium albosuccineum]
LSSPQPIRSFCCLPSLRHAHNTLRPCRKSQTRPCARPSRTVLGPSTSKLPTCLAVAARHSTPSLSRPSSRASTLSSAIASSMPPSRTRSQTSTPGPQSARPPTSTQRQMRPATSRC